MTTKEQLQLKLDKLEELKSELLRVEPFLDPNNNSYVYSSENLADISGTEGVTPTNLGEILEVVVKEINKYVEYIKKLPFAESNVIYRERDDADLALVSSLRTDFNIPITWTEKALNVTVDSVYGYLAMGEFYGRIKKMRIYASPSIRKNDISGRDIDIEVKMLRINNRLNIKSEFRSGSGALDVTLTDDIINPDDIYMIGVMVKENISNNIIYYQDMSYFIEYEFFDGTTDKVLYNFANRRVGNMVPDIDDTLTYGILYWDMLLMSNMAVGVTNSIGDSTEIEQYEDGPISGGLFDGNVLKKITSGGTFSVDVSSSKFSYRSGNSWVRTLDRSVYSLYNKNTSNVAKVIFNNLRPIDRILEEAINAL